MRKRSSGPMLLVLVVMATLLPATVAVAQPTTPRTFTTSLSGTEEVPPNDSQARGRAVFHLSKDGTELSYRLIVANIEDVTQAHLHLAPAGSNGAVVAWLYPPAPPAQLIPGRTHGVLATGTVTADDLVGPLGGATFDQLVDAIVNGSIYVNVHTQQFPGGEIRGQL